MLCKIWGFHGGDYEEFRLLGYKTPVRTSQETHYVSTIQSSQLMLCKIWGFHGSDYEEWRVLGYKNPVRTSQETHYVSATQSSQLMLCKITSCTICVVVCTWYRPAGRLGQHRIGKAWGSTNKQTKQNLWPLVRKRTISTERPPLVDEI
jgi:hypothetical protein